MASPLRAATAECRGCNYIFEKPGMRLVSETVGGGYQRGRTTNRYDKRGFFTGSSRTEGSYKEGRKVQYWLCADCNARRSTRRLVAWGLIGAAVVGGFSYLSRSHEGQEQVAGMDSPGDQFSEKYASSPEMRTYEAEASPAVDTAEPANQEVPPPADSAVQDSTVLDAREAKSFTYLTPETSTELSDAIAMAVHSGSAIRWSDGDQQGYVVVSELEPQTGCRSVFYTVDNRKEEWRSPTETICE